MDEDFIRQLNLRIEEHQNYLRERLDALQESIESIHAALAARLDEHDAYHRANEHRWGPLRLAQRYPFRLASLAVLIACAIAATEPDSLAALAAAFRALLAMLTGQG